ncbi:MAG: hypothetical protein JWQ87_1850 [Candidatus Sulfotelmatobacter sp.]|nr:hypothetical protein [Candidatus Sulfotelmatobacter sp.]
MTRDIKEHLIRCENAMQSAKPILGKHSFPDDYRNMIVIGFISMLIEHQESALLLIMHNKVGSAFALGRPIVEGAYRGLWINGCATDEEIKKFRSKDKIDLEFGQIAVALDLGHKTGQVFQNLKKQAWKALNSYTHGGMLQLGRRFTKHQVINNYKDDEIYEMTTVVTMCVLLLISRFLARQSHSTDAKAIDDLMATFGPAMDRKKKKRQRTQSPRLK